VVLGAISADRVRLSPYSRTYFRLKQPVDENCGLTSKGSTSIEECFDSRARYTARISQNAETRRCDSVNKT